MLLLLFVLFVLLALSPQRSASASKSLAGQAALGTHLAVRGVLVLVTNDFAIVSALRSA